jgi:hypothetical protein
VLSQIEIGQTSAQYYRIQLWPTPTAVLTYTVDYVRKLLDMVNDTDEPLLPEDFHHALWKGAVADEWVMKDDNRATFVRQDLEVALKDMNNYVWNTNAYESGPDAGVGQYSRLGSWYPKGS